ncbi:hypothetical protein N7488_003351 [Penicillium malachiteum]|nr:hypothetical protein N7488_003351 [Penicillium malachiteum]
MSENGQLSTEFVVKRLHHHGDSVAMGRCVQKDDSFAPVEPAGKQFLHLSCRQEEQELEPMDHSSEVPDLHLGLQAAGNGSCAGGTDTLDPVTFLVVGSTRMALTRPIVNKGPGVPFEWNPSAMDKLGPS